ncbi:MAG: hypothetical protein IJG31_05640, partial [Fusobacterium sp.]|nr:hypothetical protein [Fusobacterium sp.]
MNYDEIIEFLVKEVGKKIEEEKTRKIEMEKNNFLLIIHAGNAELSQILVELEKLSKKYNLETVYTRSAKKLSYDKISKIIENEKELSYENAENLLNGKDLVLQDRINY